jgi:hypothetical protein
MRFEWTYLILVFFGCIIALASASNPSLLDPVHALFILTGTILTVLIIMGAHYKGQGEHVKQINLPAFFLASSLTALVLGVPVVFSKGSITVVSIAPLTLFAGVLAEEVYRIAAYKLIYVAFESTVVSVIVSSIVFIAMHLYWAPNDWPFAFLGGILFSVALAIFKSETALVAGHFLFDSLTLGLLAKTPFLLLGLVMLGLGLASIKYLRREE